MNGHERFAMNIMLGFVSRLTIAFIASLLLGGAALAFTAEAVKEAEELLALAKDRFNDASATKAEVAEAEYYLLEMKFKAGLIPRSAYCQAAIPALQVMVSNPVSTPSSTNIGAQIVAQRRLYRVTALCGQN
jgi:outer membrane protein TolC